MRILIGKKVLTKRIQFKMFPMIGYKKLLLILLVLEAFRSHSQVSSYPLMIDTNELNDDEELLNPSFRMYNGLDKRDKFAYMISPISQQLIQLWDQSSSKPQEETRYIDPTILWPFPFNETSTTISTTTTTTTNVNDELNSCITSSSDIQLERENTDTLNKQVRTCRGFVRLNRCEGKCHSSAEPSVLSRNGIKQVRLLRMNQ